MPFQQSLFSEDYSEHPAPFYAIYFNMGMYNADDNAPPEILGFDCPFDDSPVLQADSADELISLVRDAYKGRYPQIEEQVKPDVITDGRGTLLPRLYEEIFPNAESDPNKRTYSFGRETLTQFWEREKYRWFP